MNLPPFFYVLFDLDGTLLDSALGIAHALNDLRATHGLPPLPYETIRPAVSLGGPGLLKLAFNISVQDKNYLSLRKEFLRHYEPYLENYSEFFSGAISMLDNIEQYKITWGIVTNKITAFTEKIFKALDLYDRASVIVCADTLPYKKPHPEPLRHACRQIHCLPEQAVYIGDAQHDVTAAHEAGLAAGVVTYGYIPNTLPKPAYWGAEFLFDSIPQLNAFLTGKASATAAESKVLPPLK